MKITTTNGASFHSPSLKCAAIMLRISGSSPVSIEPDAFERIWFQDEDAGAWIYSRMSQKERESFKKHLDKEWGREQLSKLLSALELR